MGENQASRDDKALDITDPNAAQPIASALAAIKSEKSTFRTSHHVMRLTAISADPMGANQRSVQTNKMQKKKYCYVI